ncbi:MAG: response regulator [Alphaproteobacteria bacterium]|nr:response regulator [Alphaproteobacteria bacterium]|tara:strand:- start:1837 stop:2214 length:378 start_codon:yes stop_codon:yes gene_type:complete
MANIVLAEDDTAMLKFLEGALEKAGHTVMACTNGQDAYDVLKSTPNVDLLLTDIVMPGMDGLELSQRALKMHPALKVLFITGFAAIALGDKQRLNAAKPDPNKVISKPFHLKDLVDQVEKILASE